MCAVSVVLDYMGGKVPIDSWTRPVYEDFQQIIGQLEELDRKLDQPDCVDPQKEDILRRIEERLDRLERQGEKQNA